MYILEELNVAFVYCFGSQGLFHKKFYLNEIENFLIVTKHQETMAGYICSSSSAIHLS